MKNWLQARAIRKHNELVSTRQVQRANARTAAKGWRHFTWPMRLWFVVRGNVNDAALRWSASQYRVIRRAT